ncbi:hypothetical protein NDU88_008110 [Pleurodeles waltl]|uniref:Uncharacterized protein n=1 Tax=Pleurodeles waltl TaxID=8319 RepID=A0AAV7RV46_PLEWA|nr:hypothetical protein NDU88_008110 [Pleurodeles waltl]
MSACGQLGELVVHAGVSKRARAHKGAAQQAPLAVESGGERCASVLEERKLGGAANMAAPSELTAVDIGEAGIGQLEERQMILAGLVRKEEPRAYLTGCVAPHVSSGHGVTSVHQRLGRPAGGPVSVGVRAPPGHRLEERAQSGAVRPTSREVVSLEARSLDLNLRVREPRLDSQSAMLGINEEEELDYEEETLGAGE